MTKSSKYHVAHGTFRFRDGAEYEFEMDEGTDGSSSVPGWCWVGVAVVVVGLAVFWLVTQ